VIRVPGTGPTSSGDLNPPCWTPPDRRRRWLVACGRYAASGSSPPAILVIAQAAILNVAEQPRAQDFTNQRVRTKGEVNEVERAKNRNKSKVRARVEHVFAVVKRLWGFTKVRYRGLAKNATRSFVALGLANIYLARQRLMA
jgi:hypothetical protein